MATNINLTKRLELIHKAGENGHIFTVKFRKKSGEERVMNCRLGVIKHLHGGEDSTAHIPEYVNVYDLKSEGYRKINLSTLMEINGEAVDDVGNPIEEKV